MYKNRFEIFLSTQLLILFGSLLVPYNFHENVLLPILFLLNIGAGILLISKNKGLIIFFILLFVVSAVVFGSSMVVRSGEDNLLIRLSVYFVFHIIVTLNIIKQVWLAKFVNKNVIMGLISGYISLGFLAFFMFMSMEFVMPGSFRGTLMEIESLGHKMDAIMYYAYITLLTIGYGEIVPVSPIAQKAAIFVGLIGQFYMVIITTVVIEKYIRHSSKENQ
ncbi:MAG: potassium channel family protein [Bacteroidota bacterium]